MWSYADFEDTATYPTKHAQLARLNLHLGEVRQAISADVASDGKSRSSGNLVIYLQSLERRQQQLQASSVRAGGRTYVRLRRAC